MAKRRQQKITTLLVVGEGADDQAFIKHLKQCYCPRGSGYTAKVEAGDGGSAGNIIANSIRKYRSGDYSQRVFVLDSDLPPSQADVNKAQHAGYTIILWQPQSLEGALLDVLGEPVNAHESSTALKKRLHPRLDGHHTEPKAYAALFPKTVIDQTNNPSVSNVRDSLIGKTPEY